MTGSRPWSAFSRYSLAVLLYTILVILFGAFVRASLSGDGCGAHWPTCQGALVPDGSLKSAIEYTHRLTSGILLPMMIVLVIWAYRLFEAKHPARSAAVWSIVITIFEAIIGAGLVKFGWVATDDSVERVVVTAIHLLNTFVLVGALGLVWHYARGGSPFRWKNSGSMGLALALGIVGLVVLGMTGAVTALGDTIYPKENFEFTGVLSDLSPTATFLERLRGIHPLVATSIGLYLIGMASFITKRLGLERVNRAARWLYIIFGVEMLVGVVNLFLSAPIYMQLMHLAISDALWLSLVLFAAISLAALNSQQVEAEAVEEKVEPRPFGQLVRDYIALTKPRVISLLLFTTIAAMFIAEGGWPGFWLVVAVSLGGYMAAGSANTFNMVIERDLDLAMERTASRPTVTHTISARNALIFATTLAVLSFVLITAVSNVLAALLAQAGLVFYVVIYTLVLKRRTWQNIVIGGAAGAFPPLVGYAAVTGNLNMFAWFLFALIFTWTPVHFWALAILIKDDYAKAGVPMLPVVKGDRATVIQIAFYTVLTALVSIIPLFQHQVGAIYLYGSAFLNLILVAQTVGLLRNTDRPHAKALFKYSMVYLALMFVVIAADQMVVGG